MLTFAFSSRKCIGSKIKKQKVINFKLVLHRKKNAYNFKPSPLNAVLKINSHTSAKPETSTKQSE